MKPGYKQTEVGVIPKEWGTSVADLVEKSALICYGVVQVGQSRNQMSRQIKLRRRAKRHTAGTVEHQIDVKILFFLKSFEQQIAVTSVDVPVQISEIVAAVVFTVIRKLNPCPHLHRPPLCQQLSTEDAFGDDRQIF